MKFTKEVFFLPAGVELNKFDFRKVKKFLPIKGKPVIGYIGAVTEVFDINLLEFLSKNNPNLNFVIIGRVYVNIEKLKKLDNVFFLGESKHNKLPSFLKGFDVGIIPYKVNDFTNSVYSCKLNEYLSMGIPVVSTNLNETKIYNKNHNNIIDIGDTYEKFSNKINENLVKNSKKITSRIIAAKKNSWESRLQYFNDLVNNKIINKKLSDINWKSQFIKKYNNLFYTNIKKVSLTLIFFLIIFKSPIIPFFGNFLVVEDKLKTTKMMVVFSGDGENNYHNLSFQKRILDIRNIKNQYPNIKIVLTEELQYLKSLKL